MSIFGDRVLQLLKSRGMTQSELAERAHTTDATISRYIKGEREPKAELAADIAAILNTNTDYLMGKTDNSTAVDDEWLVGSSSLRQWHQ